MANSTLPLPVRSAELLVLVAPLAALRPEVDAEQSQPRGWLRVWMQTQSRIRAELSTAPLAAREWQLLKVADVVVQVAVVAEDAALQLRPGRRRPRPVCWCCHSTASR
jgi:hypothetical protein